MPKAKCKPGIVFGKECHSDWTRCEPGQVRARKDMPRRGVKYGDCYTRRVKKTLATGRVRNPWNAHQKQQKKLGFTQAQIRASYTPVVPLTTAVPLPASFVLPAGMARTNAQVLGNAPLAFARPVPIPAIPVGRRPAKTTVRSIVANAKRPRPRVMARPVLTDAQLRRFGTSVTELD